MKQNWRSLFLITLPLAILGSLASLNTARAQITPDNSLGAESSVVTPNVDIEGVPSDRISGGAARGSNLFHSFQEFNVREGRGAYFSNPTGIENILSRVTGGNASNILGTLGVLGDANLFFINPNGIIFGPNARLDLKGSFLGSTANSLIFDNGLEFSATNPQAPPLLRVNIPIGLRFRETPGDIQVQQSILQVQNGQTLALVGGNVSVEGGESGFLEALGGRIELGGLADAGMVDIEGQQSDGAFRLASLRFPDTVKRGDVLLTNFAWLDVAGGGGGSIAVNARNLQVLGGVSGGSQLRAGIASESGSAEAQAGDITLNATGEIKVEQASLIQNFVNPDASGNGGNINITTGSLSLSDGAQLSSSTFGQGNAGNVTITARDRVSFDGVGSNESPSSAFSNVEAGAVGNGGSINIQAGSLSLTNGGQLNTFVREASDPLAGGQGIGGDVNINVRDGVSISGKGANDTKSGIFSSLDSGAEGRGGNINIKAGSLSITDDTELDASTDGKGDAGNINVQADGSVLLTGDDTGIYSNVLESAEGNGGNVSINAKSVSVTDGAQVNAFTRGRGNAGSVTITARDKVSFDGVGRSDGWGFDIY